MKPSLDFYFFLGSTYSYLSVSRAQAYANAHGVELVWKPFSVRTLMREQNNVPFAGKPAKARYMWRDIERRARKFGVPFTGTPPYPIDPQELANHVATLASMEGWCAEFVQAAYREWFLERRDPGQPENLRNVLQCIGKNPEECVSRASEPTVLERYKERTDQARKLEVFGSPTYAVGKEIFWGDDRLEDAVAWGKTHAGA